MFSKVKMLYHIFKNRSLVSKLPIVFRMFKEALRGRYKMDKMMMFYSILGIIYLVSPLDIIPDWIPLLGFFDDLGILGFIISKLTKEIDNFLFWERNKPHRY